MLCLKNLNALYQTNLQNKMLAACFDFDEPEACRRLNLRHERYFNEGVMLLNLRKWRQNHFTEFLIQYMESHKESCKSSQDILNQVLDGNFIRLRQHYNYPVDGMKESEQALEAVFLQYVNIMNSKYEGKKHTYMQVYQAYVKQSLWADQFESEAKNLYSVLTTARNLAKEGKYQEAVSYYKTVLQNGILKHGEIVR